MFWQSNKSASTKSSEHSDNSGKEEETWEKFAARKASAPPASAFSWGRPADGPQRTADDDFDESSGRVEVLHSGEPSPDPGDGGRVIVSEKTGEAVDLWASAEEEAAGHSAVDEPVTVQITNLPSDFNTASTEEFLRQYGFYVREGQILMLHVPCNRKKGTARGYFFVDAANKFVAARLVHEMNGLHPPGMKRALRAVVTQCQRGRQAFTDVYFPEGFEPRFASR